MQQLMPAVKNLLIVNVLCFLALIVFDRSLGIDLNDVLGLHYVGASDFRPWQMLTFVFMHGSFMHLFCNMFALYMFGNLIEQALGSRRFLIFYLVCGVGSGIIQQLAVHFEVAPLVGAVDALLTNLEPAAVNDFMAHYARAVSNESLYAIKQFIEQYNTLIGHEQSAALSLARDFATSYQEMFLNAHVTVGASGAVFGILLAVGLLFPNLQVMLLIPPIPLKAKWFVLAYGLIELFCGIHGSEVDNVAHWAHLGGMLFAFALLKLWHEVRRV